MSWFKIIKKDNSSDYKIPDDVKMFMGDIKDAEEESENIKDQVEQAEYHKQKDDLEDLKEEEYELQAEVSELGDKLKSLIDKYKIKDMDWAVEELKNLSPIYYPFKDGESVDYFEINNSLKEKFYVDPFEDENKTTKRGNENKKIVEELDEFQTQNYEQYGTPEQNQDLGEFISAVSNGDVSNLRSRFPFAHLVFDEAGLLGDLE